MFGAVLVLQKPCGFFVPFDDDDDDDFFERTTTNLCDAAQIAERAAASGHLRNHESFWEKLVSCNSSDDMATMASMKTVWAVIMMMIFLSMIVFGSTVIEIFIYSVIEIFIYSWHMKPLECSDPRLKALFPC